MNFSHIISGLVGIGGYILLQAGMDLIDRRGEQQVAQACAAARDAQKSSSSASAARTPAAAT